MKYIILILFIIGSVEAQEKFNIELNDELLTKRVMAGLHTTADSLEFYKLSCNQMMYLLRQYSKKIRYSIKEIDELRKACQDRYLYGTTKKFSGSRMSRSFKEVEMNKSVEESVRTYIAAGIKAEDIIKEDNDDGKNLNDLPR